MDSSLILANILNGSVFLLLGSLLVGMVTSEKGWSRLDVFTGEIFYGMLTFFLLDMGLVAAKRIDDLKKSGSFVIGFSIFMPVFNALVGIFIAKAIGISPGNALLFAILCASASYIAVPAAMGMSVPEANPSLHIINGFSINFSLQHNYWHSRLFSNNQPYLGINNNQKHYLLTSIINFRLGV